MGRFLGAVWFAVLVIFVFAFVISVGFIFVISVVIAIFGWPLTAFFDAGTAFSCLNSMALGMVLLMVLSAITAFTRDIQELLLRDYNKIDFPSNSQRYHHRYKPPL
jgi:hypothetical protein